MGFTWTTMPVTAGVDRPTAARMTEIRANTNTNRVSVGLGNYSWTKTITAGVAIEASEYTEIKTALDAAWDANTCSTHRVTHNGAYQGTNNGTYQSANYPGDNNSELTVDRNIEDNFNYSSHEVTVNVTHYSSDLGVFE